MSQLSIALLGSPQILLDKVPVKIPTSRAVPLLAYLAINRSAQDRVSLAYLLWSDSAQNHALAALRTTLWRLKRAGLDDWIVWDRNEISLNNLNNIEIDVLGFQAQLDRCNSHGHPASSICLYCTPALTEAVSLYRGEFIKGINLTRATAFDEWRSQQGEMYETMFLDAIERLVKCHRTFGDFNLAIYYSRIWLRHDPFNENAHFQLLQLYSITGQRTAGMALYKRYKDTLYRELRMQPTAEITSIYKQLISGRTTPVITRRIKTPVILISDIERAALYWARVGDKKEIILNTYITILKQAARRFGGIILQKADDSVTMLFENGQPLHCAVTLHLMLKKADWDSLDPPNLRMVLYSTILDSENTSNFAMLTRAASSLLSISWGGQIVFTDQTLKFLEIPSGSTIKDLGFHYLNETEGSVHVFELLHPNLPKREHPPLLSLTQQLFNLPTFDIPFLGRDAELDELRLLLSSAANRVVSLIGPGGVGKTRLAVQFATRAVEQFPDGVFFISFASIQDPEFIPVVVADTLEYSFFGPTNHYEQLVEYLHIKKVLLIIDNFEHLRVEGAKFLAFLLANTHYLKILVTSRERLNLIAESIMEVRGFPVPDPKSPEAAESFSSIQLFLQNARKTFPRFSSQANLQAIIRICQIVDGIPLAILLASSWVRVFSCEEIASEISKNIDFLTSSAPDLDPRHRNLSAVFDNSWKLLSEEERRIVRRLSIFKSAFTMDASREICNATPLVLSILTDKSLLYQQPDGRYMMLNTLNHYASLKLVEVEDELVATRIKFYEFYAEFCAQKQLEINSCKQREALEEMSSEIENIRIAWGLMLESKRWDLIGKYKDSLLAYHVILGNYYQGGELFYSALSKLIKLNLPELDIYKAHLQQLSVWMEFRRGFSSDSLHAMQECLEIFRGRNLNWDVGMTLFYMSEIHRTIGHISEAKAFIEQAITQMSSDAMSKSSHGIGMIAHCQATLGKILLNTGDYDRARQNFKISLESHQKNGTFYGTITPLLGLGRLAFLEGDFIRTRDLYLQALEEAIHIDDHRGMILIHNNLSAAYEALADIPDSLHHTLTALKLCKDTGDRRLTALILNNLAYQQLRYHDQPAESIHTYHECMEIFSELGDLRGIAYSSYDVSKAYRKVGLLDEAWSYCLRSLNTAMIVDDTSLVLHALHGIANFYASSHQPELALGLCYMIIDHPQVTPDTKTRAIVSRAILENSLPDESIQAARSRWLSSDLQDIIDGILAGHPSVSI